jgi:regulator of sirC expression with transglutaminase-like and TPR domain
MPATQPSSRHQFAQMLQQPEPAMDLGRASLLIACEEYPELDVARYLDRLDALAAALRARLEDLRPRGVIAALNRLLFEEEGFQGNTEDYYDPRNSFLNDVLDRRKGIPITLSAVYMEVGRRAGMDVEGVSLPGHFVVRAEGLLVDPFHGGAILTPEDCQQRLDRIYGGRLKLVPEMLGPCARRDILGRMLQNLKAIYVKAEDYTRALRVVDLLLHVHADGTEDLRDRGLLHAALDCYTLAARDLEDYLERAPGTPEAAQLREKIAELRRKAARLN